MKAYLIIIFSILSSYFCSAQDFAPVGAVWHYDEGFAFSGNIRYMKFTSVKDTLIYGKLCKKIHKERKLVCQDRPFDEYVYTKGDSVFFLDTNAAINRFQLLYRWDAQPGDSWPIVTFSESKLDTFHVVVDSVSTVEINNKTLQQQYVTYNTGNQNFSYSSKVIEHLGDLHYLFPFIYTHIAICDANYSNGLRCYSDSTFGMHTTQLREDCEYTYDWIGVEEYTFPIEIKIYPNPANQRIQVECPFPEKLEISIEDLTGKTVYRAAFENTADINIEDLDAGMYIVGLRFGESKIAFKKFVKQ